MSFRLHKCLFALWQEIALCRAQAEQTPALYRLRLLILRSHDNRDKYTLYQRRGYVPPSSNAKERAIRKWRIRSRSTRGFKS